MQNTSVRGVYKLIQVLARILETLLAIFKSLLVIAEPCSSVENLSFCWSIGYDLKVCQNIKLKPQEFSFALSLDLML